MAAKVFISYSHTDEPYKDALLNHLALLKNEGLIEPWHDRRLRAGQDFAAEIDAELAQADIVLLLISANFFDSDYCYSRELGHAMRRYKNRLTEIVPIIVRSCDWRSAPFGGLIALPKDGKAIATWPDQDEAFENIAQGIRGLVEKIQVKREKKGRPWSERSRPTLTRRAAWGTVLAACLGGVALWQPWRGREQAGATPPSALPIEPQLDSPSNPGRRGSPSPDQPASAPRGKKQQNSHPSQGKPSTYSTNAYPPDTTPSDGADSAERLGNRPGPDIDKYLVVTTVGDESEVISMSDFSDNGGPALTPFLDVVVSPPPAQPSGSIGANSPEEQEAPTIVTFNSTVVFDSRNDQALNLNPAGPTVSGGGNLLNVSVQLNDLPDARIALVLLPTGRPAIKGERLSVSEFQLLRLLVSRDCKITETIRYTASLGRASSTANIHLVGNSQNPAPCLSGT